MGLGSCRLVGLVVLIMGAGNGVGTAAEWSAAPSLGVKGVYNSNLLLSGGDNEVIGHWITPAVKFKGATEALDVEGETRADFIHYHGSNERAHQPVLSAESFVSFGTTQLRI